MEGGTWDTGNPTSSGSEGALYTSMLQSATQGLSDPLLLCKHIRGWGQSQVLFLRIPAGRGPAPVYTLVL